MRMREEEEEEKRAAKSFSRRVGEQSRNSFSIERMRVRGAAAMRCVVMEQC
jgi:hypothetical protein